MMSQSILFFILQKRIQSSAKSRVFYWTLSGRSFINRRNISGPKIVPCGTPLMTGILSEVAPSTSTVEFCRLGVIVFTGVYRL